jgi:hypothetical protein
MKNLSTFCALALCIFLAGNYQGHAQSKDQTFDARNAWDSGFAAFIFDGVSFALPLASYALRF